MTIKQTGVVDWLGIEKGTGDIILTVVDDLDWTNEQEHLLLLQEKLNTYVSFVESGEVFERLTEEVGEQLPGSTPIKVSVLAKYALTLRAKQFFEHARGVFKEAGIDLTHSVVKAPS